ncbi:hypothetical protein RO3G_11535 [Rhizopus delemar RA 99-880]|uniref:Uncharacterized protein n=1 Tax=Rhizopus delemar (strain RA 99-880 / ATCC MYA-4621 / FGSC 9543 / NRRL 43880) TaxID=246409 RepID=I1CEE4_RHIO9|nr:hypothetical protein RO3G_11535 [Rhizopus delemar RA 99-880]|eukprot:EIE86824.1 hypothetical protein RO3G_11535 [Rhizopus delemar RA 99-880]
MVTRWTLACHKKKEAAKDESEKVQEIDANNEISEANKSDSDDDSAEDVSNWEVMENDEVNVSDSMDIVEFDMPQVEIKGFQNDVVAFIAVFLTYSRSKNCCKESIFLGFCSAHPVTMAQTASVPT